MNALAAGLCGGSQNNHAQQDRPMAGRGMMSRNETEAAWDSSEYNAKRAEKAEARVAELEARNVELEAEVRRQEWVIKLWRDVWDVDELLNDIDPDWRTRFAEPDGFLSMGRAAEFYAQEIVQAALGKEEVK